MLLCFFFSFQQRVKLLKCKAHGMTILQCAVFKRNHNLIKTLLRYKQDLDIKVLLVTCACTVPMVLLNLQDDKSNTALVIGCLR